MAELSKHTVTAIIFKHNLNDTPDLRSAIAETYVLGYSRGEVAGYNAGVADARDGMGLFPDDFPTLD
jgi:hypothetical protein